MSQCDCLDDMIDAPKGMVETFTWWAEFESSDPDLAAIGRALLDRWRIAYLGTVRPDGAPRVHPVSPVIANGGLYVRLVPSSPKRFDLERDDRYVLHALPGPGQTEFSIRGRAVRVSKPEIFAEVAAAWAGLSTTPADILFELAIERVEAKVCANAGPPNAGKIGRRWPPLIPAAHSVGRSPSPLLVARQ